MLIERNPLLTHCVGALWAASSVRILTTGGGEVGAVYDLSGGAEVGAETNALESQLPFTKHWREAFFWSVWSERGLTHRKLFESVAGNA